MDKINLNIDNLIEERKLTSAMTSYPFTGFVSTEERRETWLKERVFKTEENLVYNFLSPETFEGIDTLSIRLFKNYLSIFSDFDSETFAHAQILRESYLNLLLTKQDIKVENIPDRKPLLEKQNTEAKPFNDGGLLSLVYSTLTASSIQESNTNVTILGLRNILLVSSLNGKEILNQDFNIISALEENLYRCYLAVKANIYEKASKEEKLEISTIFYKIGCELAYGRIIINSIDDLTNQEGQNSVEFTNTTLEILQRFTISSEPEQIPDISVDDYSKMAFTSTADFFYFTISGKPGVFKTKKGSQTGNKFEVVCLNQNVTFQKCGIFVESEFIYLIEALEGKLKKTKMNLNDLTLVETSEHEYLLKVEKIIQGFDYVIVVGSSPVENESNSNVLSLHKTLVTSSKLVTTKLNFEITVEEKEESIIIPFSESEEILILNKNKQTIVSTNNLKSQKFSTSLNFSNCFYCWHDNLLYFLSNGFISFKSKNFAPYSLSDIRIIEQKFNLSKQNGEQKLLILIHNMMLFGNLKLIKEYLLQIPNSIKAKSILLSQDSAYIRVLIEKIVSLKDRIYDEEVKAFCLICLLRIALDQKNTLNRRLEFKDEPIENTGITDFLLGMVSFQETSIKSLLFEKLVVKCFEILENIIILSDQSVSNLMKPELIESLIGKEKNTVKVAKLFSIVYNQMDCSNISDVLKFVNLLYEYEVSFLKSLNDSTTEINQVEGLESHFEIIMRTVRSDKDNSFLEKLAVVLNKHLEEITLIYKEASDVNKSSIMISFNKMNLTKSVFLVIQLFNVLKQEEEIKNVKLVKELIKILNTLRVFSASSPMELKDDFEIHTFSTEHPLDKESGRQVQLPANKYFYKFSNISSLTTSNFSLTKGEENNVYTITFPKDVQQFEGPIKFRYQSNSNERKDCYGVSFSLSNYNIYRSSELISDTSRSIINVLLNYFFKEKFISATEAAKQMEFKQIMLSKLFRKISYREGLENDNLLSEIEFIEPSQYQVLDRVYVEALWDRIQKENLIFRQHRKQDSVIELSELIINILSKRKILIAEEEIYKCFKKSLVFVNWYNEKLMLFNQDEMIEERKFYIEQLIGKLTLLKEIVDSFDDEVSEEDLISTILEILKNDSVSQQSMREALQEQNEQAKLRFNAWFLVNELLEKSDKEEDKREVLVSINNFERVNQRIVSFTNNVYGSDFNLLEAVRREFFKFITKVVEECCRPQSIYQYIFLFQSLLWVISKRDVELYNSISLFQVFSVNKELFESPMSLNCRESFYDYQKINKTTVATVINQVFLILAYQIIRLNTNNPSFARTQSMLPTNDYNQLFTLFVNKIREQVEGQINYDFSNIYNGYSTEHSDQEKLNEYLLLLYKIILQEGPVSEQLYSNFPNLTILLIKSLFVNSDNNKVLVLNMLIKVLSLISIDESSWKELETLLPSVIAGVKDNLQILNEVNFFIHLAYLIESKSDEVVISPPAGETIVSYIVNLITSIALREENSQILVKSVRLLLKKNDPHYLQIIYRLLNINIVSPKIGDKVYIKSAFSQLKKSKDNSDELIDNKKESEIIKTATIIGFTEDSNNSFVIDDAIVSFNFKGLSFDNSLKYSVVMLDENLDKQNIPLFNYESKCVLTENLKIIRHARTNDTIDQLICIEGGFVDFVVENLIGRTMDNYSKLFLLKAIKGIISLKENKIKEHFNSKLSNKRQELLNVLLNFNDICELTVSEILCLEEFEQKNRTKLHVSSNNKTIEKEKLEKGIKINIDCFSFYFKQEETMVKEYPFSKMFNARKLKPSTLTFCRIENIDNYSGKEDSILMIDSQRLACSADSINKNKYSCVITDENLSSIPDLQSLVETFNCPILLINDITYFSIYSYVFEYVPNEDMEQLFLYTSSVDFTSFIEIPFHLIDESVEFGQRDLILKVIDEKKGKPLNKKVKTDSGNSLDKLLGLYSRRILLSLFAEQDEVANFLETSKIISIFRNLMYEFSQMKDFKNLYGDLLGTIRSFLNSLQRNIDCCRAIKGKLLDISFLSSTKIINNELISNMTKESELLSFQNSA